MKIRISLVDGQTNVLHEFDIEADDPPKVVLWNDRAFSLPATWRRRGSERESYYEVTVLRV